MDKSQYTANCLYTGVRRFNIQAGHGVSQQLPVHSTGCEIQHPLLPPQRRYGGQHLPGYPQGEVVGPVRRAHHPALHTVAFRRYVPTLELKHSLVARKRGSS